MGEAGAGLGVATTGAQVREAALRMEVSPNALAPALLDPNARVLIGPAGAAHLRRQWSPDGTPEVVVLPSAGLDLGRPEVLDAAAGWGCQRVRHKFRDETLPVPVPPGDAPLTARFRHAAALAASRVEIAVALTRDDDGDTRKDDGSLSVAADDAAHEAAAAVMAELGVPVLSEERTDPADPGTGPWVVLDPLDGTGNFRAGVPPWAFSAALVQAGRPLAGVVVDLSSGRRWEGVPGEGARRDGTPVHVRAGSTVVLPSAPGGGVVRVPPSAHRVRVTGCTAVELCLVADGSAAAWHDVDRGGTHVHDVAGALAVLAAAGGVALDPDGEPLLLRPDTVTLIRFAAAADGRTARELIRLAR
ncbi:inositol monophosphatase family protein [Geodermatophilus marinus]|uniref:inositol monophosphatase family protein n=1 Tax=Geodermatophilus sp. LHW52908 TaxID=2303986 RepID=UPI001F1A60F6|nr:inositol monophosphatase family protein [Geodermatophilus sp. LHW52908]